MKNLIKAIVKYITPYPVKRIITNDALSNIHEDYNTKLTLSNHLFYSQEGEDIILSKFFPNKTSGFYVDIGAHHPKRFSNTYYFYNLGWRGINIDAMPGSMNAFKEIRPGDINLEIPISDQDEKILFYVFKEKALNSFDEKVAKQYIDGGWELEKNIELISKKISLVLDEYNIQNKKIDFISIDVEGLEINVLNSNNWDKYRPEIFLIEDLTFDVEHPERNEIYNYMKSKGYKLIAKTFNTTFYKLI